MADPGRAADIRVGAFVLVALTILISASLWIAGSRVFGLPRASYHVLLNDSAGLQAGDRVRVAGVSVGRIQQVILRPGEPNPVVLEVAIRREVPVREGSTARIGTSGLLGTAHLQIEPGDPTAAVLPDGSEIPGTAAGGLESAMARVDELATEASSVLRRTVELMDQVSAEIGPLVSRVERLLSDENARELSAILTSVRSTLDVTSPRIEEIMLNFEQSSAKLSDTLEGGPELRERITALVGDLSAAMGPDGERLSDLLVSAQRVLSSAETTLSAVGGERHELQGTIRDLRDTAASLKAFSRLVNERPYSLVRMKLPADRKPGTAPKEPSR